MELAQNYLICFLNNYKSQEINRAAESWCRKRTLILLCDRGVWEGVEVEPRT